MMPKKLPGHTKRASKQVGLQSSRLMVSAADKPVKADVSVSLLCTDVESRGDNRGGRKGRI
jgi:hypothetical protein